MRKTDHSSNIGHATLEDRTLDDAELNAVTGGKSGTAPAAPKVSESISLNFTKIEF
jgi:hypothetical protein